MSISLFFLVPIGLAAVVWSLCFVGVCFPTTGEGGPPYSNTIINTQGLVAYWPLSDLATSPTAQDLSGNGHVGTYTIPPFYPAGSTTPDIANPKPGTGLILQQPSIVLGDAFQPGSKNLPFSVDFEGGFVSIPWASSSPTLSPFTIEAWVKPTWQNSVMGFQWVVFGALANNFTGFALYINGKNNWEIAIGNGSAFQQFDTSVQAVLPDSTATPAIPTQQTYVAVTCDGSGNIALWINPGTDTSAAPPPAWPPSGVPMASGYMPIIPMQQQPLTFFIGAGDNFDTQLRTVNGGPGAPTNPYEGFIQSVALYQVALMPSDLASHFSSGAS